MLLSSLFEGSPDIEIKQLSIDSRLPMKDCIFFCLSGIRYNGHDYIKEAIKNGATVIVYEEDIDTSLDAVFIKVSNVEDCLNDIAVRFYNYPAKDLDTYVCAGCDGPSSVSYLLRALIENYKPCASIGVFGILYGEHRLYSSVPTLTILDNQKYLNEFRKQGMKACVFEADALSLSYKKLDSVSPDVFIYCSTNENSGEFQEIGINYYDVLCSYLYTLNDDTAIVLNRDDHSYDELIKATGDNFATYGFSSDSDFMIRNMELDRNGSSFDLCHDDETVHIKTRLLGINNVYNCTAALSALYMQGYELSELAAYLETIEPLAGVMEPVVCGQKYEVIVDCADNIANIHDVYEFASNVSSSASKIVCVWGLNSQDEKENLRDIARLSKEFIDHVILTENNSYSGNLNDVIRKVFPYFEGLRPVIIENRSFAIESAVELMNDDDILLILGKGDETTITRNLGREPYEGDRAIAEKAIKKRLNEENCDIF